MEWLEVVTKVSGGLSGIGLIIFVLIAYRIGLLQWIAEMKKNGNVNGNGKLQEYINSQQHETNKNVQTQIEKLEQHAQVANEEMKDVKDSLRSLEGKIDVLIKQK